MCFRFDGENAVAVCRPENCRERLRAAGTPLPSASRGEPSRLAATGSIEAADAEHGRSLAVSSLPVY